MVDLLKTVAQVAPSEATVLVTGESGSGKELIAGAVHYNSPRKDEAFIKMNCAAVTETLLESELFGHEKGAFTGAHRRKEGKFRQADGGSLFLDEVGEMSLSMQVKLLRALQEMEFFRVGGEELLKVDVRVIAATNKDLLQEIEAGRFREDLYYRLNVVTLAVPSMADRKEDIPLLARHFMERFSRKNRKDVKGFSPHAMDQMLRYGWPGNVRELMNAVERAVVMSRSEYIQPDDLPLEVQNLPPENAVDPSLKIPDEGVSLEKMEKETILKTLASTSGNKSEAARRLGITRKTLRKKLKNYEVLT